jgi:hypothetical protein
MTTKTKRLFETLVTVCQLQRRHVTGDLDIRQHRHEQRQIKQ